MEERAGEQDGCSGRGAGTGALARMCWLGSSSPAVASLRYPVSALRSLISVPRLAVGAMAAAGRALYRGNRRAWMALPVAAWCCFLGLAVREYVGLGTFRWERCRPRALPWTGTRLRSLPWAPPPAKRTMCPPDQLLAAVSEQMSVGAWDGRQAATVTLPGRLDVHRWSSMTSSACRTRRSRGLGDTRRLVLVFGSNKVLERVSLVMWPRQVTARIGPRAAASPPSCARSTGCTS